MSFFLRLKSCMYFIMNCSFIFSSKDFNTTNDYDNFDAFRFKPPPPGASIGWRVEFRPCELQITDFENAAVACFVVLLTRAILSYKWNLLMPIR